MEYPSLFYKYTLFLHNTEISRALALRRPENAIDFLLVNNRKDDAEVIPKLEDSTFRSELSSSNKRVLAPELENILS